MRGVRRGIWVVAALAALAFSGTAWGKCGHSHSKGNSSVAVYIEVVPTSCGSNPLGAGSKTVPLSRYAASRLQGAGTTGRTLKAIATQQALGAPTQSLHGRLRLSGGGNAVLASLGALGAGSGATLAVILGIMGATALLLLGFSVYRRRTTR